MVLRYSYSKEEDNIKTEENIPKHVRDMYLRRVQQRYKTVKPKSNSQNHDKPYTVANLNLHTVTDLLIRLQLAGPRSSDDSGNKVGQKKPAVFCGAACRIAEMPSLHSVLRIIFDKPRILAFLFWAAWLGVFPKRRVMYISRKLFIIFKGFCEVSYRLAEARMERFPVHTEGKYFVKSETKG